MISYLTSSFYLAVPFILAGSIVLAKYVELKAKSGSPISYDFVSLRRLGYYIAKLVALLTQVLGFAYLFKVIFSKLFGTSFSYPLLSQSTIEIDIVPFQLADTLLGGALIIVGGIILFYSNRVLNKLDSRKNTYLDKVYSIISKSVIAFLAILPTFFGIMEAMIYFSNNRYPAVSADSVGGQDVSIFQIIDYINGAGTTSLLSVNGVNAPGVSLALALALILALVFLKFKTPVKFVVSKDESKPRNAVESTASDNLKKARKLSK